MFNSGLVGEITSIRRVSFFLVLTISLLVSCSTPTSSSSTQSSPDSDLQKLRAVTLAKEKSAERRKSIFAGYEFITTSIPKMGWGVSLGKHSLTEDWSSKVISSNEVEVLYKLSIVIDAVDKTEYADGVRMMVNDLLAGVSKICPDNSATFTILLSTLEVLPRNACAENLLAK